jgi:hypothetical protein
MITELKLPPVEVSDAMLELAASLEQVASMIRAGEIRGAAICYVQTGPDMFVTRDWALMSGQHTMLGGLYKMMNEISSD